MFIGLLGKVQPASPPRARSAFYLLQQLAQPRIRLVQRRALTGFEHAGKDRGDIVKPCVHLANGLRDQDQHVQAQAQLGRHLAARLNALVHPLQLIDLALGNTVTARNSAGLQASRLPMKRQQHIPPTRLRGEV